MSPASERSSSTWSNRSGRKSTRRCYGSFDNSRLHPPTSSFVRMAPAACRRNLLEPLQHSYLLAHERGQGAAWLRERRGVNADRSKSGEASSLQSNRPSASACFQVIGATWMTSKKRQPDAERRSKVDDHEKPLNCIVCGKALERCKGHSVRDLERAWSDPSSR